MGKQLASLNPSDRPTAVFTNSDEVAVGVIDELQQQHFRVPDDMAVMGYDDQPFAAVAQVPLTTIRQPVAAMAQLAVDQLLHHLGRLQRPELAIALSLDLIKRKSA